MEHRLKAVTCVKELETPFLALDLQKFSANIERLQNRQDLLGALTIELATNTKLNQDASPTNRPRLLV
jgi:D-serine deaminase-like pyridoxal phosphate-dependent protein